MVIAIRPKTSMSCRDLKIDGNLWKSFHTLRAFHRDATFQVDRHWWWHHSVCRCRWISSPNSEGAGSCWRCLPLPRFQNNQGSKAAAQFGRPPFGYPVNITSAAAFQLSTLTVSFLIRIHTFAIKHRWRTICVKLNDFPELRSPDRIIFWCSLWWSMSCHARSTNAKTWGSSSERALNI